jgi:predicted alpha/beta hydrolase family esterase
MKNCIIIHGGPLSSDIAEITNLHQKHWLPWAKEQLTALGIETETPEMPNPLNPAYEEWKDVFEQLDITSETILVGHSRSCAFLLRWLTESKQKVSKVILVSPNLRTQSENPIVQSFYNFDLTSNVDEQWQELVVFCSDNEDDDQRWARGQITMFYSYTSIELPHRGHYITEDIGGVEFPELIQIVANEPFFPPL